MKTLPLRCALAAMLLAMPTTAAAGQSTRHAGAAVPQQAGPDPGTLAVSFQPLVGGLTRPVVVTNAGDGSGRLFIVEKSGVIRIFADGALRTEPFLDIHTKVESAANERGLLGLAFHPQYKTNGYFYVGYTKAGSGDLVYCRFKVSGDPMKADPNSEKLLITWAHPRGNHNGGNVVFGPDGYLYLGTGDGGDGGDPDENGQDPTRLLAKMLRIDVNTDQPYAIPPTNPYAIGSTPNRPEIWAIGFRNPWRYSFDRKTGDLYIADVGQNLWEEVDFQPASSPGGENYGWDEMEGYHCYEPAIGCRTEGMTMPVVEYSHSAGGCSVTGGYVYRGTRFPRLAGAYFYGDYCTKRVWALSRDEPGQWRSAQVGTAGGGINTFGEDEAGEVYLAYDNGQVVRMIEADAAPPTATARPTRPPAPTATRRPPTATATRPGPSATPARPEPTPTTGQAQKWWIYLPQMKRNSE